MINVYIKDDYSIAIVGHGTDEACSRVSTVFQVAVKFFKDKAKECEINGGYSSLILEKLTKAEKEQYELFVECFKDLQELYPRTMKFADERITAND